MGMNFTSLRAIIKNIKTHVRCPQCDNTYSNDDLSVISSVADRSIIVAQCNNCGTPILITATIKLHSEADNFPEIVTEQRKLEDIRDEDIVSSNDVLDVHALLKEHKGDLSEIINNDEE